MFTKSELLHIIQTTQNIQLSPPVAHIIPTKSGDGVCSRKSLEDGLKKVIDDADDRITFSDLSKLLKVDDKYIGQVLSTIREDEWGVSGRELVPKKKFAILENDLRGQLKGAVVTVIKFCRENDIQIEFFRKLLEFLREDWNTETHWLAGDRYVYSESFLEEVLGKAKIDLKASVEPTEFDTLKAVKSNQYPTEFVQRIFTRISTDEDLDGFWTGNIFVPNAYKTKQQEAILEQIKSQGFISHKALKRAYVDKHDQFLSQRLSNYTTLPSHYVTQAWLESLNTKAARSLDESGFVDMRGLASKLSEDDQKQLQVLFRKQESRRLLEHGGSLVTPELVNEMTRIGLTYAAEEGEKAWATAVSMGKAVYPANLAWRDLLNSISIDHLEVPTSSIESIGKLILPKASTKYVEKVSELRETASSSAKLHFVDKIYLRFTINVTALSKLQDPSLQEKLAQDLITYYQRIIVDGLAKLLDRVADNQSQRKNGRVEDAINSISGVTDQKQPIKAVETLQLIQTELSSLMRNIDMEEPTEAVVTSKKREMQRELKTQLEKATDVSLMMLVVLILLFSELEDGILRATGKYAPKILKQLKSKMQESDSDFLTSVKAAVISKSELSNDDVERLRQMGFTSAGTS